MFGKFTRKSNDIAAWLNGKILTEVLPGEEIYVLYYDVTDFVRVGSNDYTVKVNWYENDNVFFALFGEYHMAFVKVNGVEAGKLFFDTELDISHVAKEGENDIEIKFILSNRNRMGPHHIIASRREGVSPWSFELSGDWAEDTSKYYHSQFDFKKFYI